MCSKIPYDRLIEVLSGNFFKEGDEVEIESNVVLDNGVELIVTHVFSTDRPDKSGVYIELREIKKKEKQF